jgi:hypothetical protein
MYKYVSQFEGVKDTHHDQKIRVIVTRPEHVMCAGEVRWRACTGMAYCRLEHHRKASHRIPTKISITNVSLEQLIKNIKMKLSLPLSLAVVITSASAFAPTQKAFVSSKLLLFGSFLTPA